MSHEFRTPLNAILGFSEMMRVQYFGPLGSENYRGYAGDIHHSGEHLLDLVNDILDIAAIEGGKRGIDITAVDLEALLLDCIKSLEKVAAEKSVEISTDIIDGLPTLHADRRAVKQIAINLLSNAVKFTEPGGTITISAYTADEFVVIVFKDTGIGMPAEDAQLGFADPSGAINISGMEPNRY